MTFLALSFLIFSSNRTILTQLSKVAFLESLIIYCLENTSELTPTENKEKRFFWVTVRCGQKDDNENCGPPPFSPISVLFSSLMTQLCPPVGRVLPIMAYTGTPPPLPLKGYLFQASGI